ncbi:MAG: hypothetical protein HY922_10890 [Elusimicrobia bacterium]|nr:hypothetical protein [Elusimicrobiota bacterium]
MEPSSQELKAAYLREQLEMASKASRALEQSFAALGGKRSPPRRKGPATEEKLEVLTARFARLADILTQKVFRALDAAEFADEGSFLDRLNRMEKRAVIPSAKLWRDIRDIRNQIAHEYALKSLAPLQRAVMAHCPDLFEAVARVRSYVQRKKLTGP